MKLIQKTLIFVVIGILALLVPALAFILHFSSNKTVKVGFYKVTESHEEIIRNLLEESSKDDLSVDFKFLELDREADIVPQAKKADILFTPMGFSADKAVASIPEKKLQNALFDSKLLAGTSISASKLAMSAYGSDNEKVSQIPLFFDGYEMLISIKALSESKTEYISSWSDAESLATKVRPESLGIIFAGGNADSLLGVVSVLTEAFDGKEKFNSIIEKIKSYDGSMQDLFNSLYSDDEAFHGAMDRILKWKEKEILSTETLNTSNEDLITIIENQKCSIIIMPLSEHRKLSTDTARFLTTLPIHSNESNFYFPSIRPLNTRSAMTPSIAMISMSSKELAKAAVKVLLNSESQEKLAFKTGLAPFLANSKIPDMQSDDLRFWIAATSIPSIPMGHAAFDNENRKEEFAETIREWIRKTN